MRCMGVGLHTPNMAFFTLSDVISPFSARLATSAALVYPDDRQAMVIV